jgi:hypothetical protein
MLVPPILSKLPGNIQTFAGSEGSIDDEKDNQMTLPEAQPT